MNTTVHPDQEARPNENALETLLRQLAEGEDNEVAFYTELEHAPLYVLGHFLGFGALNPRRKVVGLGSSSGESVEFVHRQDGEGDSVTIPCFSSIRQLENAANLLREQYKANHLDFPYILTTGAELFRTLPGVTIDLNPGAGTYQHTFSPKEIAGLLGEELPEDAVLGTAISMPSGDFVQHDTAFPPEDDENPLERALRLATHEPAQAPHFYRTFLASNVFVLIDKAGAPGEVITIDEDTHLVAFPHDGGWLEYPVFSSEAMMQASIDTLVEQNRVPFGTIFGFMEVTASSLLEDLHDQVINLNPLVGYGRPFLPHELQYLLAHGMPTPPGGYTDVSGDDVTLTRLAEPPAKLVDALTQLFTQHPIVQRAYLVSAVYHSLDPRPGYLICLDLADTQGTQETEEQIQHCVSLIQEATHVANRSRAAGEDTPVFFTELVGTETGTIDRFIADGIAPFYERAWAQNFHHHPGHA